MWYNRQVNESWPLSQTVKTSPSHGEDMGSIPVGVTTGSFKDEAANLFRAISSAGRAPGSQSGGQGFDPPMVHQRSTPPPRRWGASLVDRVCFGESPLRRSGAKRADCHDCTAPVREPTDTRRNECAVGTLKKFANLSPHISVQIPLVHQQAVPAPIARPEESRAEPRTPTGRLGLLSMDTLRKKLVLPGFFFLSLWLGDKKITKRRYFQDFGGARTHVGEDLTQQARKN